MKRNKKRAAVGILLAGIAGFLAYSFYLKPDLLKFLPNSAANRAEEAAMGGNGVSPSPDSLMTSGDTPKKIYAEGESVSFFINERDTKKGAKVTGVVDSSAASKQMPAFLRNRTIDYRDNEKVDENGTLTSPHSYVTIQVTLKSEGAEIPELCIYFNIMPLGENNQVERDSLAQLIDHDHAPKADTKTKFFVDLNPNQEETYTLYYILPDTDVDQQLYLVADCTGSTIYKPINFIKLSMNRQG